MFKAHIASLGALAIFGALALAEKPGQNQQGGYFGIGYQPAREGQGIMVVEVTPGSPAEKAGLKAGDVINRINDQDIRDEVAFRRVIAMFKAGAQCNVRVLRGGRETPLMITLGEQPRGATQPGQGGQGGQGGREGQNFEAQAQTQGQAPGQAQPQAAEGRGFLGVQTQDLTPDLKRKLNLDTDNGVVITEVAPNSVAQTAGLKKDDVIIAVGTTKVKSMTELRDAIKRVGNQEVPLEIIRNGEKKNIRLMLQNPGQNR